MSPNQEKVDLMRGCLKINNSGYRQLIWWWDPEYSSKLQDIIDSPKAKETKLSEILGRLHICIHIPGTGLMQNPLPLRSFSLQQVDEPYSIAHPWYLVGLNACWPG